MASRTIAMSKPLAGRKFFPLWGIVEHRGRKSGRELSVPVVVRGVDGGVLIPLPWGPTTNWVRNVLAAGECVVVWKGSPRRMGRPKVVGTDAAGEAFSGFQRKAAERFGITNYLSLQPI